MTMKRVPKRFNLTITQDHVDRARKLIKSGHNTYICENCPTALALKDMLPDRPVVSVNFLNVYWMSRRSWESGWRVGTQRVMSSELRRQVRYFSSPDWTFEPGTYEITSELEDQG